MKVAKRLSWCSLRNIAKRCRRVALGKLDSILTKILVNNQIKKLIQEHQVRRSLGLLLMWVAEMRISRNSKSCITGNTTRQGIEATAPVAAGRCRCICPGPVLAKCWILIVIMYRNSMVPLTEEARLKRKSSPLERPKPEKMVNQTMTMSKKQIFFCSTPKCTTAVKERFTHTETPSASRKNSRWRT